MSSPAERGRHDAKADYRQCSESGGQCVQQHTLVIIVVAGHGLIPLRTGYGSDQLNFRRELVKHFVALPFSTVRRLAAYTRVREKASTFPREINTGCRLQGKAI